MGNFVNPYQGINWEAINHYKAGLHNHIRTEETHPDTWEPSWGTEEEVVQTWENHGFDISARTEKNEILTPESGQMLMIPAFERTYGVVEHTLVLFANSVGDRQHSDIRDAVQFRAHPHDEGRTTYSISQMIEQFKTYESLVGLEMISRNHSDMVVDGEIRRNIGQYIRSGNIWDQVLKAVRSKNIYGIGVIDGYNNHTPAIGDNVYNNAWTEILATEKTEEAVKSALQNGEFFFVSHMAPQSPVPKVTNIEVDGDLINVSVEGAYHTIYWFYGNEVVATGDSYDMSQAVEGQEYIRFEIWTKESDYWPNKELSEPDPFDTAFNDANIVGSQPFLFDLELPPEPQTRSSRTSAIMNNYYYR